MVIRFKTDEETPRYLAFCSERKTWTTNKPKDQYSVFFHAVTVSVEDYIHIMREIDFNGYDYSEDLTRIPC